MTGPALSGVCAGGAVRIQFSVGHKRDGAGEMAWGERGGGEVDAAEREGLGDSGREDCGGEIERPVKRGEN